MKHLKEFSAAWTLFILGGALFAQVKPPLVAAGHTKQIAEDVYVIPDQRINVIPNIGIIVGRDGVLVVDTGMGPRNAETVLGEVRKITSKPVAYLTITHFHPEHGMGAQAFPASTIVIYPTAQKTELLEKGPAMMKQFSGVSPEIADLLKPVRLRMPNVTFSEQAEVDLGNFSVQLLHWNAAHTRGDNFVFLPKQRIVFGGDVVINRFFPIMADSDSSGANWIETLDHLQNLKPAIVVPGHGEVGDVGLITAMRDYFVLVRDRVRDMKSQGSTLADVESKVGPEVRAKYKDWENPEWIKNAIDDFYSNGK